MILSALFRKKNIHSIKEHASRSTLKKNLGVLDLILLGLGAIIGTGLFVLTGLAAANYAGPGITISYLIGGVAAIFTALAYAELASTLPASGGAYTYVYVSLGEFFAALIGWTTLMLFAFGGATVAAGWSGYILGILTNMGIAFPEQLTKIPAEGGLVNLPAIFIIFILSLFLVRGTQETAWLNRILVTAKLGAIFLFLVIATPHMDPVNWQVFAPKGIFGIIAGAGFVFMSYTGFDTLAMAAEECKNPNRDLPIGIIVSIIGSAALYIVVSAVLTLIAPYHALNIAEPMAYALRIHGVTVGAKIVAAGALAGMTTVILTQIYGQSRLLLVMSRDGLLPSGLNKIHSKFSSPYLAVMMSGLSMIVIAGFMPVSLTGQLASMASLSTFSAVSLAVMILRKRYPAERRPFRCPAVYGVASMSMLLCLFLLSQLILENWRSYFLSLAVGILVYCFYGYRNSIQKNTTHEGQVNL